MQPSTPAEEEPLWLRIARREIGQRERAGSKDDNPRIIEYLKCTGLSRSQHHDETPWCAAFACWCLEGAGIRSTRRANARSFLSWGKSSPLQIGALAVLTRGTNPSQGHVGIVVGWTDSQLLLLGGNQSNRVTISAYPRSRLIGLRWPLTA